MRFAGRYLLLLLAFTVSACAAQISASDPGSFRQGMEPMLVFENASTETVRLYLMELGSRWPVGHVQPGQVAVLRLPAAITDASTRHFSLVAVPIGARTYLGSTSGPPPGSIESEPMLGNHVVEMRWRLVGTHLLAYPLPARRQ